MSNWKKVNYFVLPCFVTFLKPDQANLITIIKILV